MIVDTLALRNFVSYGWWLRLDFSGMKTIGIAGDNEAGKSTILRAISYVIYGGGQTDREVKLINDRATSPMLVRSKLLLDDGPPIEIERGRTLRNEAVLKVTGMSGGPTAVQQQLEERIGLDKQDFVDLSYFVQGDIHAFMTGNKRAYFQRWTRGLEYWARLEAAAREARTKTERRREHQLSTLSSLASTVSQAQELSRGLESAKARLGASERAQEAAEVRVSVLQREIGAAEARSEAKETIQDLQLEQDELTGRLEDCDARVGRIKKEMLELKVGKCPLLGIACAPLKKSGKKRKAHESELSSVRSTIVATKTKQAKVKERIAALVASTHGGKAKATHRKVAETLRIAERHLATVRRDVRNAQTVLARAEADSRAVAKAKSEMRKLKAAVATAEEELRRWSFLQFMCGKSGIPSGLIEDELSRVEDKCNWVLERLHYSKRIRFSPFKELAGYEKVCPRCGGETWRADKCASCGDGRPRKRKDEPTVTVLDGDAERAFDLESGGARVLQSFAARLAASLFVSAMTGVPFHMVMLDEIFAMLDPSNRQKLMALVLDKLTSEFGLRRQFVVSHHDDVVNAVDDLLIVRRQRGLSVARWA